MPSVPKSSCYFCPFKRRSDWAKMRSEQPELFARSIAIEKRINEKRAAAGKDPAYLTAAEKPLDQAVDEVTASFLDDDLMGCESGYRMT